MSVQRVTLHPQTCSLWYNGPDRRVKVKWYVVFTWNHTALNWINLESEQDSIIIAACQFHSFGGRVYTVAFRRMLSCRQLSPSRSVSETCTDIFTSATAGCNIPFNVSLNVTSPLTTSHISLGLLWSIRSLFSLQLFVKSLTLFDRNCHRTTLFTQLTAANVIVSSSSNTTLLKLLNVEANFWQQGLKLRNFSFLVFGHILVTDMFSWTEWKMAYIVFYMRLINSGCVGKVMGKLSVYECFIHFKCIMHVNEEFSWICTSYMNRWNPSGWS